MNGTRRGAAQVASAAALWGTWSIFLRWSGLPGLTCAALLMTTLAVAGMPAQWRHRHERRPRALWAWMFVFGLLDAGNTGFFFLAVENGSVAVATLCHYLAPMLTPLMALLFLRERPSRRTYPAALIGLLGLGLLVWPSLVADSRGEAAARVLTTAVLGGASAVFYATLVPLGKKLGERFTPFEVQGIHSYVSAALLWLLAAHGAGPPSAVGKLLLGCCVCGILAGGLFYSGIRRIPAGLSSVLTYLEPLVATAVGVLLFGERLRPIAFAGAALVIGGGLYLASEVLPSARQPQARVALQ